METKLIFNLANMNIISYEAGNMKKVKQGANVRPVCALMLSNQENNHKVKVLFKGDKAKSIDKYITTRRSLGDVYEESVYMVAQFREQRKDCVVVEAIDEVCFASFIGV